MTTQKKISISAAGFMTIVAAAIGGMISHYGFDFGSILSSPNTSIYKGEAKEIQLSHPLPGFVTQESPAVHRLIQLTFEKSDNRVNGHGTLEVVLQNGDKLSGHIRAQGRVDGDKYYLVYEAEMDSTGDANWLGVAVLRRVGIGDINGYWIANNIYPERSGFFTIGEVKLVPQ